MKARSVNYVGNMIFDLPVSPCQSNDDFAVLKTRDWDWCTAPQITDCKVLVHSQERERCFLNYLLLAGGACPCASRLSNFMILNYCGALALIKWVPLKTSPWPTRNRPTQDIPLKCNNNGNLLIRGCRLQVSTIRTKIRLILRQSTMVGLRLHATLDKHIRKNTHSM